MTVMLSPNDFDPVPLPYYDTVRVYWNTTKSCWSLLTRQTWQTKHNTRGSGWRLAGYTRGPICLDAADFLVYEAGRKRTLAEGRKNVHAYIEGTLVDATTIAGELLTLTYNPYKDTTFVSVEDDRRWPLPTGQATRVRLTSYPTTRRVGPSVIATWSEI